MLQQLVKLVIVQFRYPVLPLCLQILSVLPQLVKLVIVQFIYPVLPPCLQILSVLPMKQKY